MKNLLLSFIISFLFINSPSVLAQERSSNPTPDDLEALPELPAPSAQQPAPVPQNKTDAVSFPVPTNQFFAGIGLGTQGARSPIFLSPTVQLFGENYRLALNGNFGLGPSYASGEITGWNLRPYGFDPGKSSYLITPVADVHALLASDGLASILGSAGIGVMVRVGRCSFYAIKVGAGGVARGDISDTSSPVTESAAYGAMAFGSPLNLDCYLTEDKKWSLQLAQNVLVNLQASDKGEPHPVALMNGIALYGNITPHLMLNGSVAVDTYFKQDSHLGTTADNAVFVNIGFGYSRGVGDKARARATTLNEDANRRAKRAELGRLRLMNTRTQEQEQERQRLEQEIQQEDSEE